MDLQKSVRYRVSSKQRTNNEYRNRIGRTYSDFLDFITDYPSVNKVEMDIVEGLRTDKKCILTFVCITSNMLFFRLLDAQTSEQVTSALNYYEETMGIEKFKKLFGVILTDNGSEFNDYESIEFSAFTGERRTRLFYCGPYRSDQKGTIERKHVDMRLIIPKRKSIDFLTQKKVDLMNSHINAIIRPTLINKSSYDFSVFIHGPEIVRLLNITKIPSKNVLLNPTLVK